MLNTHPYISGRVCVTTLRLEQACQFIAVRLLEQIWCWNRNIPANVDSIVPNVLEFIIALSAAGMICFAKYGCFLSHSGVYSSMSVPSNDVECKNIFTFSETKLSKQLLNLVWKIRYKRNIRSTLWTTHPFHVQRWMHYIHISPEQFIKFSTSSEIEVLVIGDCWKFQQRAQHSYMFACLCITMPNVPTSGTSCESSASISFIMRVKAIKILLNVNCHISISTYQWKLFMAIVCVANTILDKANNTYLN